MKKVLLIGLGGTGCSVVARVKKMVKDAEERQGVDENTVIRFLGVDTDVNQSKAPDLDIVRTSREAMVEDLLRRENRWHDWFPDNQMLRARYMSKGAGQVRALSRLALSDTMRRPGALQPLDDALSFLQRETGHESEGLKIMIVSSFAGGTGSGIFLQIPLFLRKYIENKYPGGEILIRGLFALPDIFLDGTFSRVQRESMYANAYASLKELAVINKICLSNDASLSRYDLKIDNLFDSRKILNTNSGDKPRASRKPYDFIFFMDNVNSNNNVLSAGFDIYNEEMAKVTYMQIYGPMATTADSREDNLILTQMSTDGEAMYGSAGSARIIYPYEDILHYFACRTMGDVVSSQWDIFDKRYKELVLNLKEKQKSDPSIKIPEFGDYLIDEADKKISDQNSRFFFLQEGICETKLEEIGSGDETRNVEKVYKRNNLFENEVEEYLNAAYNDDFYLNTLASSAEYTSAPREPRQTVEYNVEDCEDALHKYYRGVDERIYSKFSSIADSIIPDKFDVSRDDLGKKYNVRNLLEQYNGDERIAVHPLAARYLLYSLLRTLTKNQEELKGGWENDKNKIEKYWIIDRDPKTKDITDSWSEAVPSGLRGILSLNSFKKKYAAESRKQKKNIENYGRNKFKWLVNDVLIKRINALLGQYQRVFNALENVEEAMKIKSEQIEDKYSNGLGDIYNEILSKIYTDAMEAMKSEPQDQEDLRTNLQQQWYNRSVVGMFENGVLPHYQKELHEQCQDVLNMNVYQALKKQSKIEAEADAERMQSSIEPGAEECDKIRRELLTMTFRKAAPYLNAGDFHTPNPGNPSDTGTSDQFISPYWGMSRTVYEQIRKENSTGVEKYMAAYNSSNPEVVSSIMYSDYELCCYRALYSVRLEEIQKFRESEDPELQGEFYKNYVSRVRKMQEGRYGRTDEGLTPHIDIRWHSKQYLPMISGAMDEIDTKKAARAMWLAFFYKCLDSFTNEINGKQEVRTVFTRHMESNVPGRVLKYNGAVIPDKNKVYEIFKAFQQNDLITNEMLKVLEPVLNEDCIEKSESYQFDIVPITAGLIGTSAAEESNLKKQIKEESDPEMQQYLKKKLFSTNALSMLQKFLHSGLAAADEKKIVSEELWKIIKQIREPSQGRLMSEGRFADLLMRIFVNSPYVTMANRIKDNANLYILDPYFESIMAEYDRREKENAEKKRKSVKKSASSSAGKKKTGKSAGTRSAKTKKE